MVKQDAALVIIRFRCRIGDSFIVPYQLKLRLNLDFDRKFVRDTIHKTINDDK